MADHFNSIKGSIDYFHPQGHQIEEFDATVELDDGSELSGYCAVYEYEEIFSGRKQKLESQAFVFKKGNWYISFRITYPMIKDKELIRKEVNLLVNSFDYAAVI